MHPTDQALRTYGLGKLDDDSARSIGDHLESCSDCRRRLAELAPEDELGPVRAAASRPDSARPIMSTTDGLSMLDAEAGGSPAPPPASTLPPGFADHPDYEIARELGRGG